MICPYEKTKITEQFNFIFFPDEKGTSVVGKIKLKGKHLKIFSALDPQSS